MLRIQDPLIAPFEILVDTDQYQLVKPMLMKNGKTKGTSMDRPMGYYTTLDALVKRIAKDQLISEETCLTLSEFLKKFTEKIELITNAIKL